jgi:NADH-quinone oxidoreductase subunit E
MSVHRRYDFKYQHFVGEEGKLIPLLQQAQLEDGYLRRERLLQIQQESGIPLAHIYGVATFFAQFRFKPIGKYLVKVCHGTACHVSGADDLTSACQKHLAIDNGGTTPDRLFSLETVACLGCCSLAPAVMINQTTFGNLSPSGVVKILKRFRKGEPS